MKKRFLSLLLVLGIMVSMISMQASAASFPFTDVPSNAWYREAVEFVYDNGIMNGKSDTRFVPSANLLRGEMCQILYNLEGRPGAAGNHFSDVSLSDWYYKAVNWAYEEKIVNGMGNGRFEAETPINREQMVQIIFNYAKYKGYENGKRADLSGFSDSNTISNYAVEAFRWAVAEKVITGTTDTTVTPKGKALRSQIATVMMNFLQDRIPQQPAEDPTDSVKYDILRKNHTYLSDTGDVKVEAYYDLVVVEGDSPAIRKINDTFITEYQAYVVALMEAVESVKDMPGLDYRYTVEASVTNNQKGVFSVSFGTDWMMGGVHNYNIFGGTFDIATGEKLSLPDLFPSLSKDKLATLVKNEIKAYMQANPNRGWMPEAETTVANYAIDEMKFIVCDGKITVLFYTYELTYGFAGPVSIELSSTLF